jgi:hypothetical protein
MADDNTKLAFCGAVFRLAETMRISFSDAQLFCDEAESMFADAAKIQHTYEIDVNYPAGRATSVEITSKNHADTRMGYIADQTDEIRQLRRAVRDSINVFKTHRGSQAYQHNPWISSIHARLEHAIAGTIADEESLLLDSRDDRLIGISAVVLNQSISNLTDMAEYMPTSELRAQLLVIASNLGAAANQTLDPCLAKRQHGEPFFVLLGRDPAAIRAMNVWCDERRAEIAVGTRPDTDEEHEHIVQVRKKVAEFSVWLKVNRP